MMELVLFGAFLLTVWYWMTRLPDTYPPTPPIRLPILGHAHYLGCDTITKKIGLNHVATIKGKI